MKNFSTKSLTSSFRSINIFVLNIAFLFFITGNVLAQVTFTQTSDADFNLGYHDNVLVSGNNVYLPTQATGINNWLTTTDLPKPLINHKLCTWKNFVYLSGGFDGTNTSNAVYRATISAGGNGSWTTYDTLPEPMQSHAMVTSQGYLYVIGGENNGILSDKVYYSKINSDGTLGVWTLSSITLPELLRGQSAAFYNGFLYVVGGASETSAQNTVYYAKVIGLGGELSAFTTTSTLPVARDAHTMLAYDNKLIVLGGIDNTNVKQSTVYYSNLNLDGTCNTWVASNDLMEAISNHSSTCYNGYISVIGGETIDGLSNKIYYASIDDLPTLTWNLAVDTLYEARKNGAAYAHNGQVVFAGGENISASPIHNTRYASVTLGSEKIHNGSFMSYPFLQLGEERDIETLSYNITYNDTFNNYDLIYRLAGSDQLWGDWVEAGQNNPTLVGENEQSVQYMFQFDGTDDGNVVLHDLTVNISGYTQLSGNLNGMDTLKLVNSPFWATGSISFTGSNHYIEAGVNILFSPNTGLEIGQANMNFAGTEENPVTLTSYSSEAGLWNGVYFNTHSDNGVSSSLNYVMIEKAGAGSWNANLYCVSTNEPQVTNCSFALAVGNGLRLNDADLSIDLTEISGNTENGIYVQSSSPSLSNTDISSNGNAGVFYVDLAATPNYFNCTLDGNLYGLYYPTPNYSFPVIEGIISYNNTVSGIAMSGGDITADQTWPYNPLGYAVLGKIRILKKNSKVRLTINPGNTIVFDSLAQLQVGEYIYYQNNYGGELHAIGTADSTITFTSINSQPGGWEGVFFHYNSDSFGSTSELKFCNIQNGNTYNIKCQQTIQPRIDSCIITNSNKYSIYVEDPNSVPHITASTSNVFVNGGTQSINKTWYNFGNGDYVILSDIIVAKKNDKATLSIQPGVTIEADTSAMIQLGNYIHYQNNYGGELFAEGAVDSLITFTSRNGLVGGWDGIYFHYNSDSYSSTSSLKHCIVEKGNSFNIMSSGSAQPRIDNCTINNTNGYDIWAAAPNDVQHVTNTNSTLYVGGGTQSWNKTWWNYGGDYVVLGDIVVALQNAHATLTIEPGNTVKIDTSAMIQVGQYLHYQQDYGGRVFAEGTSDSLITFTSRNELIGGWDGIYFHYNSDSFGSTSSFKYCTIEKGKNFNIKSEGSAQPRIDSCTINNTDGYDIWANAPNDVQTVTATNSTIYVGGGTQSWDKTWKNFGGEYVVIGSVIVAKQNSFSTLTIEPGNTINFNTSVQLQLGQYLHYLQYYGGEIIAKGTHDSLIMFRSSENVPGGWNGIYFHDFADNYGGNSSFEYCIIEGASVNNIYCHITNAVNFEHVTFANSAENGVHFYNSSPYLKLCQVINNDSIGIKLSGNSQPVIGDTLGWGCDIYGNGDFGIYNLTGNLIHAKNNFWDSTDSTEVAEQIYDHYDNGSYGIVEFMPLAETSYFDNHPPDRFGLITLFDYEATADQTPAFTWEIPTDPNEDVISYYHYYTDDSTWTSNVVKSEELSSPNYTIPSTLTGGKWYWWKVKATDGYLSRYSNETRRFAISLPPSVPEVIVPSNGSLMHEEDYLSWVLSSDPDLGDYVSHYRIQLDDDADFSSPEVDMNGINSDTKASTISLRINELTNYFFLENKTYYWRVSAIDGFGIESDFSDGSNYFLYQLEVFLKVYLEGPYSGSSMTTAYIEQNLVPLLQPYNTNPWNYMEYESVTSIPNAQVVDWILVQLRSTPGGPAMATEATSIFTKAAFVLDDGSVVDLDGFSPFEFPVSFDDNTYVVVYHRNHLPIISAFKLSVSSGKYEYDFSTNAIKVYGGVSGYKNLGVGVWGMAGGDGDSNKMINENDVYGVWSDEVGNPGYLQSDFNFDAEVDNMDKNDVLVPNIGKESQVPE